MRYILLLGLAINGLYAQAQRLLPENEAVEATLRHSAATRAAQLSIRQNQQLLKSTYNLPNPDLIVESPTGSFYTLGITQTFEFPTVYARQKSVQVGQIGLAEKEQGITQSNLRLRAKQAYLNAQVAQNRLDQLQRQDSCKMMQKGFIVTFGESWGLDRNFEEWTLPFFYLLTST